MEKFFLCTTKVQFAVLARPDLMLRNAARRWQCFTKQQQKKKRVGLEKHQHCLHFQAKASDTRSDALPSCSTSPRIQQPESAGSRWRAPRCQRSPGWFGLQKRGSVEGTWWFVQSLPFSSCRDAHSKLFIKTRTWDCSKVCPSLTLRSQSLWLQPVRRVHPGILLLYYWAKSLRAGDRSLVMSQRGVWYLSRDGLRVTCVTYDNKASVAAWRRRRKAE